ncbi:phytanoyl-CoA dioxygenase family protein [Rhodococcus sp. NPDC058532]|uniref:phytanoyl-CoA dioxygenase family protein n=1 Tax=Rhodococcus sp. NPDC058532 TaxID=3346540 RepID=UPI003660CEC5
MREGVDRYPSRVADLPEVLDRLDPVLWGTDRHPELAHFEENGYLQRMRAISDETAAACRAEIERIRSDPALVGDERIVREESNADVRSIFDVVALSAVVREAIAESGAADLARRILGSEVYIHQSRLNHKPGFVGGAFYWHSDFETWHAEDGMPAPRAVSASIALTPNESHNGPLMILPGTQWVFVQCRGETPPDHHRESLVTTTPRIGVPSETAVTELAAVHGIDVLTGPVGSMTVFDSNVLHASGGNITPMPRSNIFVVFNSVSNRLQHPYAASTPRPLHLAARG